MQIDPDWYFDDKADRIYELAESKFDFQKLDFSGNALMDWCFEMKLMEEPKIVALLLSKILMGKKVGTESIIADLLTSFGYGIHDEVLQKGEEFIGSKYGDEALEEFRNYFHSADDE